MDGNGQPVLTFLYLRKKYTSGELEAGTGVVK
jgi:hypothetical protein